MLSPVLLQLTSGSFGRHQPRPPSSPTFACDFSSKTDEGFMQHGIKMLALGALLLVPAVAGAGQFDRADARERAEIRRELREANRERYRAQSEVRREWRRTRAEMRRALSRTRAELRRAFRESDRGRLAFRRALRDGRHDARRALRDARRAARRAWRS
jgi:hypothetical protein